ncbi:DUF47 domain-containing protein [Ferviditalea candida]|uniref:DUF47 family protein n=1 Tax=Ferviditalea candida TaxID=3108399 RepID=A0ABU5ZFM5_9BACL|nr:DUF47 family protein [Paenibacillaceae bacterium T2]
MLFRKKEEIDFFQLFIRSAENSFKASNLFREAIMGTNPASYLSQIKELENIGDELTHQIFRGLNKSQVSPLAREDIMELTLRLDDVIDGLEATISRFDYLNVQHTDKYMREFSEVLMNSCDHLVSAFKLLSNKKYMQIKEHIVEINSLENEGDRLMREGIREIFTRPKDPYHDFKLKELYERMEQTTDACEDVANVLESIVLRYA